MDEEDISDAEEPGARFLIEGRKVASSGKVTVPAKLRKMYDIEHNDVLDCVFIPANGEPVLATDLVVDLQGRVRIPARKRRLYGIEDGDVVSVEVTTTEMVSEASEEN